MKWIILLSFISLSSWATAPLVFMRENSSGKQIVLLEDDRETVITTSNRLHLYPDISPDGKWITWVEGASERDLTVILYHREKRTREQFVTRIKGQALQPRFSKNGSLIFFSAPTENGNKIAMINPAELRSATDYRSEGNTRIYQITPDFVPHEGQGFFPRPSSDGSFVVFQRNTFLKKEIVEYSFKTRMTRVLASGVAPALSLDENRVAYSSRSAGSWDIWLIDRGTATESQHTNDPKDEVTPTFLPDGSVAFASNRTSRFQLFQAKNGEWISLTSSDADDDAPNFAGNTALKHTLLAPMLSPLRSSFAAIAHNGKVYVCGGHTGPEHTHQPDSFLDNLQVYDPETNSWKELAPRPHKAHGFQLAAYGHYLYAFGGFAYSDSHSPTWKSIDVIDRYDITTNEWTTIGKLPRARSSHVVAVVNDKAYLIGGHDATPRSLGDLEGTFHAVVDVFDLERESLTEASWSMPDPLRRAMSSVTRNGRIYLIGGRGHGSAQFDLLSNVTQINPATGFTVEMTTLPSAAFAPATGLLGDELLVFGGMYRHGPQNYDYVAHIYSHDLLESRWQHTGRFLRETKGFAQVVKINDGLMVLGGHHYFADRDEPVNTVEFYSK